MPSQQINRVQQDNLGVISSTGAVRMTHTPPGVSPLRADQLVQTADELSALAGYLADMSAARSQFLSKVAHELRTPLTVVKGWASMLRHGELLPAQERIVDVIDQQVDELARLVNDLLDLSRHETGTLELRLEPTDLASLVEQIVEYQRELTMLQGIQLLTYAYQPDVFALVDRGRLAQVINNLISNACRYVAHHGNGQIELIVTSTERVAQLSVCDNGTGIAPEHLARLFEPFYQIDGKRRGRCGLGLTIARELVCAHGGSITVESTLGQGTRFHIWLRRTDARGAELA